MYDDLTQYGVPVHYMPLDGDINSDEFNQSQHVHWEDEYIESWEGSRAPVSKWAATAKLLRSSYGEWVHVEGAGSTKSSRRAFANHVASGRYPSFDPEFFKAKIIDGEVYMRFSRESQRSEDQ